MFLQNRAAPNWIRPLFFHNRSVLSVAIIGYLRISVNKLFRYLMNLYNLSVNYKDDRNFRVNLV